MRIIAKKYDGITHENTSELELARLQSELRRTDDVCNPVYNPSILTSRDGDTERHIWTIELQGQTTQFIIRHTHPN